MLAVPGELPAAGEDGRWAYELKWDGVRAIGYVQDGTTRLLSRNDLDVSISYPEALDPPAPLRQRLLVLDGELVALDEQGRPNFGRLQERMHVRNPAAVRRLAGRVPVFYYVFDLLRLDDHPLLAAPALPRFLVALGRAIGRFGRPGEWAGSGWRCADQAVEGWAAAIRRAR